MDFKELVPKVVLDPYDRTARLYPGLLALLPVPVALVCMYGSSHPWISAPLSILSFCGGGYLLGRISRDAGIRLQEGLFAKCGGAPTTQLLRFRDTRLDRHTKERYHAVLSKGIGKSLPTPNAESADAAAADEMYRAATAWLKEQTRDSKRFPLVLKENIAFGFHRNCLGIRRYGIAVGILCTVWILVHSKSAVGTPPYLVIDRLANLPPAEAIAIAVSIATPIIWLTFLTEGAANRTAFAYAERLLQSCDHLSDAAARPVKKKGKV